jgi:Yip1 domain
LTRLAARVFGVIRRPRSTFATIVEVPSWAPVLAATTVVTFLCGIAFLRTEVGQQALVDQWERTATAFGQPVDDEAYGRMEEMAGNVTFGTLYAVATAVASGPALVLVLAGLLSIFLTPGPGAGAPGLRPSFGQVLAVVSSAGVILALRQVVATPIDYFRESIASPTTLVQLFSMLDETSPVARFLGIVDLFVIWWIAVLAIGLSVLYQRSSRRLVLAFAGAYIALALLAALAMAISGGTA